MRMHFRGKPVAAPMFLCSGVDLAAASCNAGTIGSLTRNHYGDMEELESQFTRVAEQVARHRDVNPGNKIGPLRQRRASREQRAGR